MMDKYADIINLPHHVSKRRPQMEIINRAAQFSPFAALKGYEEAIEEKQIIEQEASIESKTKKSRKTTKGGK